MTSAYSSINNGKPTLILQPLYSSELTFESLPIVFFLPDLPRTCRLRTEPTVSVNRMRCVCCASALSTVWRRKSWLLPSINWMWTRRSSRPACLTRSLPATSAGPSYRPSWNTRSKTRSGDRKCVYAWMCVRASATQNFKECAVLCSACQCVSAVFRRRMRCQMTRRSTRWLPGVRRSSTSLW